NAGYVSTNVNFSPYNFVVTPGDMNRSLEIMVDDPLQDAEAWLWVVNAGGGDTLQHLLYHAPKLSFLPASAQFLNETLGVDTCTQFVFKNNGTSGQFPVTGVYFTNGSQGFRV